MPITSSTSEWTLVWSDEFEGTQIDRSKWDFDIGNGFFDYQSHQRVAGWGNEELQYYTSEPENVFVKYGLLTIRAVRETLHGCGYTSARLKTPQARRYAAFHQAVWPLRDSRQGAVGERLVASLVDASTGR